MKLLIVSDIHDRVSYYEKAVKSLDEDFEGTIIAGDLTYFKPADEAISVLKRVREISRKPVYFVPGNCDPPAILKWSMEEEEIFNVHLKFMDLNNYDVYGIGGGNISPFNTLIEWGEEEFKTMLPDVNLVKCEKLIMVTHTPIKGIFDEVRGLKIGSASFLDFLQNCTPLVWITGHVHEHRGIRRYGKTTVIHPGPLMKGYFGILELNGVEVSARLLRA